MSTRLLVAHTARPLSVGMENHTDGLVRQGTNEDTGGVRGLVFEFDGLFLDSEVFARPEVPETASFGEGNIDGPWDWSPVEDADDLAVREVYSSDGEGAVVKLRGHASGREELAQDFEAFRLEGGKVVAG